MPKFKLDENLPQEAADLLRNAGYDAETIWDQQMVGAPDSKVASVCKDEDRVLVTLDLDFADTRLYRPADHAGHHRSPTAPTGQAECTGDYQ